jgi:hypothetical protein
VIAALLDHPPQGRREMIREGVARLGAVEGDQRNAVADFAQQLVGSGVNFDPTFCHLKHSRFDSTDLTQSSK